MGYGHLKVQELSELEIQHQIIQYFTLLQNKGLLFWYRLQNGPRILNAGKKIIFKKSYSPGLPDLIVDIINGPFLWIELKTGKGKLTDNQLKIQENCKKSGKIYAVYRSLQDCICHLESHGIKL